VKDITIFQRNSKPAACFLSVMPMEFFHERVCTFDTDWLNMQSPTGGSNSLACLLACLLAGLS
jgi:hypothetical protein